MSLPPAHTAARSPSALEQHRDVAVAITYSSSPSRESMAAANGTTTRTTTATNSSGQKVNKVAKAKTVVVRRPSTGNKNNMNGPTTTSTTRLSEGASSQIPSSGRPSLSAALFAAAASSSVPVAVPTSATPFNREDDNDYDEDLPLSAIPSLRNTMAARVTLLPDEVVTSARPSGRVSYRATHTRKSAKETVGDSDNNTAADASSSSNNTGNIDKSSHVPSWGYNNSRRHKQEMLTADRLPGMPARIKIYGAKNVLFDTCPGDRFYPAATFGRGALLMTQRRHIEIEVEADEPEKTLVGEHIVGGERDEYDELIFGGSSNNKNANKSNKNTPAISQSQHDAKRGPNGRPLIKKRAIEKPMLLLPEADGGVKVEHGHTYHVVTLAANPHTEGIMTPQNLGEDLGLADLWKAVPSSARPSMGGAAGGKGSESDDSSDNEEEGAGGRGSTVQRQRKNNADSSLMNAGECPTDAFWWKQQAAAKRRRGSAKMATTDASSLQVNSNNSGRASNRNLQ